MKQCGCIERIKAGMKETHNLDVSVPFELFSGKTFTNVTYEIDNPRCKSGKQEKGIAILHSFCPFCGAEYEVEE
jgi:hypothetical protein